MARRALLALLLALVSAPAAQAALPGSFALVGHTDLGARGMNAALALNGDVAYVGSRSDGPAPKGGIAVVDVSEPSAPRMLASIGRPGREEADGTGEGGLSSRELRVSPELGVLAVLQFACEAPQTCMDTGKPANVAFYDVRGDRARAPRLLFKYEPSRVPHEFFLWEDPVRPGRVLLYLSTLTAEGGDDLLVADISAVRSGVVEELASFSTGIQDPQGGEVNLHSLSVSPDGRKGYVAHLSAGFLMLDTSEVAAARPKPRVRLLTPIAKAASWGRPGAHSALPLPGRPWALAADEVYGVGLGIPGALGVSVGLGCPWGWTRLIDVRDPATPVVRGEFRLQPFNDPSRCTPERRLENETTSFSSHNPTVTQDLALLSWHSGGLQAIDLADPTRPKHAAEFFPTPIPAVLTEDPTFSAGTDKVVMWSYPVIRDGLIYVADVRNGLYVLRYSGPHEAQVRCASLLEGNSNVGTGRSTCPLDVARRPARARRDGLTRLPATCTTREAAGCVGVVEVRLPGGRLAARKGYRLRPGEARALLVRPDRLTRRRLARARRLTATVTARTQVGGGETVSTGGPLTLLAPRRGKPPARVRVAAARAPRNTRLATQAPPTGADLARAGFVCLL